MRKRLDLSIIILNYNTKDLLRDCLKSVQRAKKNGFSWQVAVVDNASSDDSVAMVKKEFPEIKLIASQKNLGFSAGNNLALSWAKGRYLLFLNPDTRVFSQTFSAMLKFMESHPQVGAATCRVELPNGQLDDACHRGFPTPWNALTFFTGLAKIFPQSRLFAGYTLGFLPKNKTHEIDAACGAFFIVRRKAGDEVGWWDEDYFWYGEDIDFCYRLKEKGWQIFFVPQTKIIHYKGAASGLKKQVKKVATATKETRLRSAQFSTKVMRTFYQKHYQDKYPQWVTWLVFRGIDLLEKIRLLKVKLG